MVGSISQQAVRGWIGRRQRKRLCCWRTRSRRSTSPATANSTRWTCRRRRNCKKQMLLLFTRNYKNRGWCYYLCGCYCFNSVTRSIPTKHRLREDIMANMFWFIDENSQSFNSTNGAGGNYHVNVIVVSLAVIFPSSSVILKIQRVPQMMMEAERRMFII